MANEPSKPQTIPLAKIHDLPGVFIPKQPDKSYGGLVTSIQASGVKEAVILRKREDGEYQLVSGYRRRRACELAKLKEIPAYDGFAGRLDRVRRRRQAYQLHPTVSRAGQLDCAALCRLSDDGYRRGFGYINCVSP